MFDAGSRYEWVYQAPRWRTVLVLGKPVRLFWPHLAFLNARTLLYAFALEGPIASEEELVEKLRYFPFTAFHRPADHPNVRGQSHIDHAGRVCFDSSAADHINHGKDIIEVFWNSGFSVFNAETLHAWRLSSEADIVALRPFPHSHVHMIHHVNVPYSKAWWLPGEPKGT